MSIPCVNTWANLTTGLLAMPHSFVLHSTDLRPQLSRPGPLFAVSRFRGGRHHAQCLRDRPERHVISQTDVIAVDLARHRRVAGHPHRRQVVVADQMLGADPGLLDSIWRTNRRFAHTFMLVVANTPRPVSKVVLGLVHTGLVLA